MIKRSLKNDNDILLPVFKKAVKILNDNGYTVEDEIVENYENYKFKINDEQYEFYKKGKVSQVYFIIENILLKGVLSERGNL